MAKAQETEVINLDSDDDDVTTKNKSKKKTCNSNCINFKCTSGLNMRPAPSFACSFYGVNMAKKKKRHICESCLENALNHQEVINKAYL